VFSREDIFNPCEGAIEHTACISKGFLAQQLAGYIMVAE
jgi:hypothetical protein